MRDGEEEIQPTAAMTLEEALVIGKTAVQEAKENAGALLDGQAPQALSLLRSYEPRAWMTLKQKLARTRGVALSDVIRRLPVAVLHPDDRARLDELHSLNGHAPREEYESHLAGEMLPECPLPTLRVPKDYTLRTTGIARMGKDQEGNEIERTIAHAPVVITGRLRDTVLGEESLLTAWRWLGSGWTSRVVGRAQLLAVRSLVTLAGVGFPVADDSAKALVGYLHRLEALNRRALPCAAVSSHLGWQGEEGEDGFLSGRTLILADGTIEEATALDVERPESWSEKRVAFHGLGEGDEQIVGAFHSRGSLAGWLATAERLAPYPKALLALYAGFAAPLLQILNCPNFVVDWSNRTSTGKTTCVRIAGSIWGNPDERAAEAVVYTWDATRVWTERASHVLQSLPLILDDTKKAKNPKVVAELIYAVASGRGRGRGNVTGLARTVTWRTILLSTGEQPATSFTQDGGTRTRCLAVRGLPFERENDETRQLVNRLNIDLCQNYGHAGPLFIQWLQQNRESWPEWREYARQVQERLALEPGTPEAGRLAQYAAVIHTAGVMAHRALALPWDFADPLLPLWTAVAAEAAEASGEVRALRDVVSWAHSHIATFDGRMSVDYNGAQRGGVACSGRWDRGDDWEWIGFHPNVLKQALRDEGYEPESILAGWRERGWLLCPAGRYTSKHRVGPENTWLICLLRSAIDEFE